MAGTSSLRMFYWQETCKPSYVILGFLDQLLRCVESASFSIEISSLDSPIKEIEFWKHVNVKYIIIS